VSPGNGAASGREVSCSLIETTRLSDPTFLAATHSAPTPRELARALRAGTCPADHAFDRFLPHELLRVVSGQYWTPLVVAARAAAWFADLDVRTVVDIGSGAGKFCVAAALSGRCHFTGLEHRSRLVDASRTLSQLFGVDDQVRFVEGTLGQSAIPLADAYYLYNPFGENLFASLDHLDEDVELGEERYDRDIAAVEDLLRRAHVGTCVLTYNGFGGQIPSTYRELRVEYELPSVLRLWQKTNKARSPDRS
jgi:predicted RNA methylase